MEPASVAPGSSPPAPPTGPRHSSRLWVAVGIVVVLLVLVAAAVLGATAPSPVGHSDAPPTGSVPTPLNATVTVTDVNWTFAGASGCWSAVRGNGTTASAGETFQVTLALNYTATAHAPSICTVETEAVTTPGFVFERANTPLVVHSGVPATLNVTVLAPGENLTSGLTLEGNVTNTTLSHSTTVTVSAVHWNFTGAPACWVALTSNGTQVAGGQTFAVSEKLSYTAGEDGPTSCTVRSEKVGTTGFTLVGANTPLTVDSGNTQTLNVELRAPDTNVTGPVDLEGTVTIPNTNTSTTVHISGVNWEFSGASNCWSSMTGNATVVTGGENVTVTISLSYTAGLLEASTCTVQSESVATSGFTYEIANTPLVVSSGSTQILSVTVQAPNANETVVLTLDGQVTSP